MHAHDPSEIMLICVFQIKYGDERMIGVREKT